MRGRRKVGRFTTGKRAVVVKLGCLSYLVSRADTFPSLDPIQVPPPRGMGGGLLLRPQQQLREQMEVSRRIMADAASQFRQLLLYLVSVLSLSRPSHRSKCNGWRIDGEA